MCEGIDYMGIQYMGVWVYVIERVYEKNECVDVETTRCVGGWVIP